MKLRRRLLIPLEQLEPHYSAAELGPMPVHEDVFTQARIDSNKAIVMCIECGVPISETYKPNPQPKP